MSVTSFKDTLDKVSNDFIDKYVTKFNSSPDGGLCTQNNIIMQDMEVAFDTGVNLKDCILKFGQTISYSAEKPMCADINARLMNMETNAKKTMIEQILNEIIPTLPDKIKKNTVFTKLLKEKILFLLMNIDATIQANCSSGIYVSQKKKIYFLGKVQKIKQPDGTIKEIYPVNCQGSTLEFTQEAIVKQFVKCIVTPAFDVLQNDPELKAAYDINPDQDCYYEEVLLKPCDGYMRTFSIKVVTPQKGNGTCPYVNGDIIQKPCNKSNCKVTDWEDWSPCINNKQTRTRKVLTPGNDCPNFIEERACIISSIPADLSLRGIEEKKLTSPSEQIVEINSSNWFVFGFDKMPETQKKILYAFLLLLLIVFLYALI